MNKKTFLLLLFLGFSSQNSFAKDINHNINGRDYISHDDSKHFNYSCLNENFSKIVSSVKTKKNDIKIKEFLLESNHSKVLSFNNNNKITYFHNNIKYIVNLNNKNEILISHGTIKSNSVTKWNIWQYTVSLQFNNCIAKPIQENSKKEVVVEEKTTKTIAVQEKPKKENSLPEKPAKEPSKKETFLLKEEIKATKIVELPTTNVKVESIIKPLKQKNSDNIPLPTKELIKGNYSEKAKEQTATKNEKPKDRETNNTLLQSKELVKPIATNKPTDSEKIKNDKKDNLNNINAEKTKDIVKSTEKEKPVEALTVPQENFEVNTITMSDELKNKIKKQEDKKKKKNRPKRSLEEEKIIEEHINEIKAKNISTDSFSHKKRLCLLDNTQKIVSKQYPNYNPQLLENDVEFKAYMDKGLITAFEVCFNNKLLPE